MGPAILAAVAASLPLLWVIQASIDDSLERARFRGEDSPKPNRKVRNLSKRAKRRAAVAIIRELEREMRAEETVCAIEREMGIKVRPSLPIKVRPSLPIKVIRSRVGE